MVPSYANKVQKVTFNTPEKLKELDKWQKGVTLALDDKAYMALSSELTRDDVLPQSIHQTIAKTLNPNYKINKS